MACKTIRTNVVYDYPPSIFDADKRAAAHNEGDQALKEALLWQAQAQAPAQLKKIDIVVHGGSRSSKIELPDQSPLDRVKSAILELPNDAQHEVYKFLYTLGHRI